MNENGREGRVLMLMVLFALWVAAFGFSIYLFLTTPDKAAATIPGLSRTVGLIGWQGVAGMFAIACWGVGWSFPRKSGLRRISILPLLLAFIALLVVVSFAVFPIGAPVG